jgi:hypothetical protein
MVMLPELFQAGLDAGVEGRAVAAAPANKMKSGVL